jgi:predicted nucleic acid-binding protein
MSFLLDTNVVSEWTKPLPNPGVTNWIATVPENEVFLSVVSVTELRYGIERMPMGSRRTRLDQWLVEELVPRFDGRIIPVDLTIADTCGKLVARSQAKGRPVEPRDAFIAATAEVYELTLVTRNASDFQPTLSAILSPWS